MINLMPNDEKTQLRAARTNSLLIRYMFTILGAGAFLMLILSGSYFLLNLTKTSAEGLIAANDTKASVYSETEDQIKKLSADLTDAKNLLDQQLSYSKALQNLGSLTPKGVVMKEISLKPTSFDGTTPTTIELYATNRDLAATIEQQFKASPYFSSVTFGTVSETDGIKGYPVSATLTVVMNRSIAQ